MKKEEIQFQIDQLRKDKIIYATESAAVSITGMLLFIGLEVLTIQLAFLRPYALYIASFSVLAPLLFLIYMGLGNLKRLKKINELEKSLDPKKK